MNIFIKLSNLWHDFFRRRRLSLQDSTDNRVLWYTHISPLNLLLAFISYTVLIFVVVLTLVGYTSILEMLPLYRSDISRSRNIMVENILRIDSMERVIGDMMLYNDNISLIMEGKTPVVRSSQLTDTLSISKVMVAPNSADSILRKQMEGEGEYNLRRATINQSSILLISPMEGYITQRFDITKGTHSIKIEAIGSESKIEAAGDGTVIFSQWTPELGYVVGIQHPKGIVSIYKNLSQSHLIATERVKGGEVIGYSLADREFEFELWEDGKPVNPENYIIF